MLPRLCSNPPHGAELWGAESAESHPHRSTRTRELQCALVANRPYLLPFGSISSTLTRSLVLVTSLFLSSAVVNSHFSCPNSASVLSSYYSRYLLTWNCLQLEFSDNDRFKAGVHVRAVFMSLNTAFLNILVAFQATLNLYVYFINDCLPVLRKF